MTRKVFFLFFFQVMFSEGNVMLLHSQASGTNIRIYDGEVQGSQDDGPACQDTHIHLNLCSAFKNAFSPF